MNFRTIALVATTVLASAACERDKEPAEEMGVEKGVPAVEPVEEAEEEEVEPVAGQDSEKQEAADLVQDAAATLKKMKSDPELKKLLSESSGVFIVPNYGRVGLGVGGRGGEGVLLSHEGGKWSNPAFYDIGGVSIGAQLGAEGGEIAMILMSDQALDSFKGDDTFSLNADADFTIVDYSKLAQTSLGKDAGSVIFWSDTEGAFAGATLSATDISWDDEANPAYYGKRATPEEILGGKVSGPKNTLLEQELTGM